MKMYRTCLRCAAILGLAVSGAGAPIAPVHAATVTPGLGVDVQWLYVDARQPRTLLVSGTHDAAGGFPALQWTMRSTDGGATWDDLSRRLGSDANNGPSASGMSYFGPNAIPYPSYYVPPIATPDDRHLLLATGYAHGQGFNENLLVSSDGGLHWLRAAGTQGGDNIYIGGITSIATTPAVPGRVYGIDKYEVENSSPTWALYESNDGAMHWLGDSSMTFNGKALPEPPLCCNDIVADPGRVGTIYIQTYQDNSSVQYLYRSTDDGGTWTPLPLPFHLNSLTVAADRHEGTALLGTFHDKGLPADRRFLSKDYGTTWSITTCPGDAGGSCPVFTVDEVFGAGASYAFVRNGIYRFQGGGKAATRLGISAQLPARTADLLAVAGGSHAGDPIYLLTKGIKGSQRGLLYRSTDTGATWQLLSLDLVLPGHAAPSAAPGALYVAATHHSVAPPFVAAYRRLGLQVTGFPVTEAYTQNEALQQDFEHLRLALRAGHVVRGDIGVQVTGIDAGVAANVTDSYDPSVPYDEAALKPVPPASTTQSLYFPETRHSLAGSLLRYWKAHGGMSTFGAPISEVFNASNNDGSARTYAMQWFQNARLELHPELHNPRYAILEGLVGNELLEWRGELPVRTS